MGKKKKSLANKLAKMSDEEKARYLQHKAEVEEEAKKRKEQLISTFMKNKIKKEDAFSRLNLAKINQYWHQMLRKQKCKELRDDIQHMQKCIDHVVNLKNRTITLLLEELDDSEKQYSNNLKYHLGHIDQILDSNDDYLTKLQLEYQNDINVFLAQYNYEKDKYFENCKNQQEYLKTIIFAQNSKGAKKIREEYESYLQRNYQMMLVNNALIDNIKKSRVKWSGQLWLQISDVVKNYVNHTDSRRLHMAELHSSDASSAIEIRQNQERINLLEEQEQDLKESYGDLIIDREIICKKLNTKLITITKDHLTIRQNLHKELSFADKKIKFLTSSGSNCYEELEKIQTFGTHVLNFSKTCQKFEKESEFLSKYIDKIKSANDDLPKDETLPQVTPKTTPKSTPKITPKLRPKTAFPKKRLTSSKLKIDSPKTPESIKVSTLDKVIIQPKRSDSSGSEKSSDASEECINVSALANLIEPLEKMENFWTKYNKVEVECQNLSNEKAKLSRKNKQLKTMLRAVLEASSMAKSIPNSAPVSRIGSRSAPLRRLLV